MKVFLIEAKLLVNLSGGEKNLSYLLLRKIIALVLV